ncbi:hypothetical protein KP509_18G008900 [Ceratopteris richardii]|uniref:CCHC-type domain-containing protein n=1 Tax=Ceratopteris richardii TaxID=49495 RepID=A0A8T2SR22_CERRI|nr:hypothetical protein KP509_18G008900 [Ceratopteris richardii]
MVSSRFDGTDFPRWKAQMWHTLVRAGLHMYVHRDAQRPRDMPDHVWMDMDALASSTIRLQLVDSIYESVMYEETSSALWQRLHDMYVSPLTHVRHRSHRRLRCWHCGHEGHIRRCCFRRMRRRRQRYARDVDQVVVSGDSMAVDYASDGDITFSYGSSHDSSCSLDSTHMAWLLDALASFHVTPHREWFCRFSSESRGCVHMPDGTTYDIEGAGDICLMLPSGASLILRHVRYVPSFPMSLISVSQLQESRYYAFLGEHHFQLQLGQLMLVRGARIGHMYPLQVLHVRDNLVSVGVQPYVRCETRHVSFCLPTDRSTDIHDAHVWQDSDAQMDAYVEHVLDAHDTYVEHGLVDHMDALMEHTLDDHLDALEHDMDAHIEHCDDTHLELDHQFDLGIDVVQLAHVEHDHTLGVIEQDCSHGIQCMVEHISSHDAQLDTSLVVSMADLYVEESAVMQSFLDSLMPDVDTDISVHVGLDDGALDALDTGMAGILRLARIAQVSSTFGSLMYELLCSRPDIAVAIGAFALGVVSRLMIRTGIERVGALQELHEFLHLSDMSSTLIDMSLEQFEVHGYTLFEAVGVG